MFVAHRHGVALDLLYRWRRLLQDGGEVAVGCDSDGVGLQEVRVLKEQVRKLERLLARKMLETEILKEAVERFQSKKQILRQNWLPKGVFRRVWLPRH